MDNCNCGREGKYAHISNGKTEFSCNKYHVCLPYDDLLTKSQLADSRMRTFEDALYNIKELNNGEDFEYWAIANEAIKQGKINEF